MVRLLLWINGLVYVFLFLVQKRAMWLPLSSAPDLQIPYTQVAVQFLGLVPAEVVRHLALWQLVTYMFLHISFWHLLLNMLGLWWFGVEVERLWGSRYFLWYYFFTGIGAALTSLVVALFLPGQMHASTFGASGAIFGLLLAYGLLFPNRLIYLYFVIPVKAKYCVLAFFVITLGYLVTSSDTGVSHSAHLGGGIFGVVWFLFFGRDLHFSDLWRRFLRWKRRRRLRVIRRKGEDDDSLGGSYSSKTVH